MQANIQRVISLLVNFTSTPALSSYKESLNAAKTIVSSKEESEGLTERVDGLTVLPDGLL